MKLICKYPRKDIREVEHILKPIIHLIKSLIYLLKPLVDLSRFCFQFNKKFPVFLGKSMLCKFAKG